MVGLRDQVGLDRRNVSAVLLNGIVFAQRSERTTLGLELNHTNPNDAIEETENDFELLVMPQWHQECTEHSYSSSATGPCRTAPSVTSTAR
jgi:hypothetical protein